MAAHKILPASNERQVGRRKIKNAANHEKTVCGVAFLASPARFELTAFRLGGERSILLSYGDRFLCQSLFILHHNQGFVNIEDSCRSANFRYRKGAAREVST